MPEGKNVATKELIDSVKFDDKGLVPAICQDAVTGEILMMAWMNRESLAKTLKEGKACYWSRSRQKLWLKGESSGHVQRVIDLRIDCDADCVLIRVEQEGPACHTGYRSCFYRRVEDGEWREEGNRLVTQEAMDQKYGRS